MARFPQLERLARYCDEDEKFNGRLFKGHDGEGFVRTRSRRRRPIDQLPIDEVFRRINAGEYLE